MDGFLFIDKERGMTSFDIVKRVRKIIGVKKVGHAGTLDPLATGLMILAFGKATRLLEYFLGMDKVYEVKANFGAVSDSYDANGVVLDNNVLIDDRPGEERIKKEIKRAFLGEISQVPPKYSALKIGGKRACDIVREGGEVKMKARKIEVKKFNVDFFEWPLGEFEIECGSGTYVRSLIHDLGQVLGVGAYVEELRRVSIGDYSIERSLDLEELTKIDFENALSNKSVRSVCSMSEAMSIFKSLNLSREEFDLMKNGQILMDKKIERGEVVMAYLNSEFFGVLEEKNGGVKFKKLIV